MQTRPRLLQFITSFRIGGTEKQFVSLGRGLDAERFDLRIACLARSGELLQEFDGRGTPIAEYLIRSLYDMRSLGRRLRFARDLRRSRIDIVHSFGFYPNLFAVPAAWIAGAPVVLASIRDTGEFWSPAQRRAQRLVCGLADRVLVNSRAVADSLAAEGYDRSRITIISNGVDLSRFDPERGRGLLRRELGIPPATPVVAVVARLNPIGGMEIKGVGHFLEAAAILAGRFPDARFLVVGDGPARAGLERMARRLGPRRVVFTGFRRDVARILADVSVAVVPSLSDGLSNSLLEAMAAGVPVVATRVGGNPEAVEEGVTGFLVPPADSGSLARSVGLLLENAALRAQLGRAARRRIAERFSMQQMIRSTEELYASLLADSAPRARAAFFMMRATPGAPAVQGRPWS